MNSDPRLGVFNGALYMVRDVRDEAGKHLHCEYATQATDGPAWGLEWHRCVEGVSYAAIAPVATLDELKRRDCKQGSPTR